MPFEISSLYPPLYGLFCTDLTGDLSNQACINEDVGDLIHKYDSKTDEEETFEYNIYGDLLYNEMKYNGQSIKWVRNTYDAQGNFLSGSRGIWEKYIVVYIVISPTKITLFPFNISKSHVFT